jgi:hypothetical protein
MREMETRGEAEAENILVFCSWLELNILLS